MGQACGMHCRQATYIQILVAKPEGKTLLGRPRCRYNMETDVKGIGWEGMASIRLAQDRENWSAVLNMVRNLLVPQNKVKFLTR
jgi:hypothetical protein